MSLRAVRNQLNNSIHGILSRIWNSPTLMIWVGHSAKTLQLLIIMPLVFSLYDAQEITVWLMFLTLIGLQLLADMGFTVTFTRALSIAFSGVKSLQSPFNKTVSRDEVEPNLSLLAEIVDTMKIVYLRLSFLALTLLVIAGTAALYGPIMKLGHPVNAWLAWLVLLLSASFSFYGNSYVSYLQAAQYFPLIHRLRSVTTIAATLNILIALYFKTGLLGLVLAQQIWQVVLTLLYRYYALNKGMVASTTGAGINKKVFEYVWQASWRSGLGILFGYTVIQSSGLIYAQFAPASQAALYLLMLRLMQAISLYSQAPFYSKLPQFSRLWAKGDIRKLRQQAARGMRLSYWVYALGVVVIGVVFPVLLNLFNSNIKFPDITLWALFGLGGLIERFGAMHIQIYSLTNHILWHIANGVTASVFIIISMLFVPSYGVVGFAIGLIISNLGFYSWYSARYSYRVLKDNFMGFDLMLIGVPFLIIVMYLLSNVFLR